MISCAVISSARPSDSFAVFFCEILYKRFEDNYLEIREFDFFIFFAIYNYLEIREFDFFFFAICLRSPLWSSGQSFWLQIQRSRVRFPALPDFLSSSGSGTGSTQPREIN